MSCVAQGIVKEQKWKPGVNDRTVLNCPERIKSTVEQEVVDTVFYSLETCQLVFDLCQGCVINRTRIKGEIIAPSSHPHEAQPAEPVPLIIYYLFMGCYTVMSKHLIFASFLSARLCRGLSSIDSALFLFTPQPPLPPPIPLLFIGCRSISRQRMGKRAAGWHKDHASYGCLDLLR